MITLVVANEDDFSFQDIATKVYPDGMCILDKVILMYQVSGIP